MKYQNVWNTVSAFIHWYRPGCRGSLGSTGATANCLCQLGHMGHIVMMACIACSTVSIISFICTNCVSALSMLARGHIPGGMIHGGMHLRAESRGLLSDGCNIFVAMGPYWPIPDVIYGQSSLLCFFFCGGGGDGGGGGGSGGVCVWVDGG